MQAVTELLKVAESLSGAPLAVLLIIVLIGGYRGWWNFGRELTAEKDRCAGLIAASEKREADWRELALSGAVTAKNAVDLAKTKR